MMQETKNKRSLWLSLGLFAVLLAALLGIGLTHHLVWVDYYPLLIRRVKPGLAEPISSFGLIQELLWDEALETYPLTVKALMQSGQLTCDSSCEWAYRKVESAHELERLEHLMAVAKQYMAAMVKELKDECGIDIYSKGPQPKTAAQVKNLPACCEALKSIKRRSKLERVLDGAGFSPQAMAALKTCDRETF